MCAVQCALLAFPSRPPSLLLLLLSGFLSQGAAFLPIAFFFSSFIFEEMEEVTLAWGGRARVGLII